MTDACIDSGLMFGDRIDQLTSVLRHSTATAPDSTLEDVCARLSRIAPLSSAGLFRSGRFESALEWMHLSTPALDFMNQALVQNREDLRSVLNDARSVQFGALIDGEATGSYFVGIPAGQFNGAPLGLGVSCDRELNEEELSRLGPFGWLLGLIAENARLSSLVHEGEDAGSSAHLIGFIAHELRTPLTGMRGNIQLALMANRKGQHDRIPGRLEAAINGVDNMSRMVQKLLDVSRLERGAFQFSFSSARFDSTIEAAIEDARTEIEGGLPPVRISAREIAPLHHDQPAMQRAVANLISCVGSIVEAGTGIDISITEEASALRFVVTYTGARLSGDEMAALSAPLSSVHSASERNNVLSLDLAYLRGVVQGHNGEIQVRTDHPSPGRHEIEVHLSRLVV